MFIDSAMLEMSIDPKYRFFRDYKSFGRRLFVGIMLVLTVSLVCAVTTEYSIKSVLTGICDISDYHTSLPKQPQTF